MAPVDAGGSRRGEGVGRIAAETRGISQARNDVEKLEDRSRPGMRQQQRKRLWSLAIDVEKVQVDAMQRHLELRECVEARFLRAPVEAAASVLHQLLQIRDARAVRPGLTGRLIWKPSARETLAQIADRAIRNVQSERLCRSCHDRCLLEDSEALSWVGAGGVQSTCGP